ncbi:DUF4865 family protein [Streptomyces liangshanensis]|uniref:DUF4865 family protein n=1 Tax=Streptomyces liangshanensis TaxID=2717324 RepID=UPI0036DBD568
MHAMQYEITLPADYDMGIIRARVATKGHLLDDFPGLGLKAYLMRERGPESVVNQYAPFYLWAAQDGMNAFLLGAGFDGVVRDFGRPEVQHWTGLAFEEGPASTSVARTAVRRRHLVPETAALPDLLAEAVAETRRLSEAAGVVCAALALDPRRWELVHFTLWNHETPRTTGDRFQVLHVSQPNRATLASAAHR